MWLSFRISLETPEKIVILIPVYNEEQTITKVIVDFQRALPEAEIYVCDNNSEDKTSELAREAGAQAAFEPVKAKATLCGQCSETLTPITTSWWMPMTPILLQTEVDRLLESLRFFGILALFFIVIDILVGISVLVEFARTQFITCISPDHKLAVGRT